MYREKVLTMITSTPSQNAHIHKSVMSHKLLGTRLVLGWDYHSFEHKDIEVPVLLTGRIFGVQKGEAKQIEMGVNYALEHGYEYFLKSAGDVVILRPLRLEETCEKLEELEVDLISERVKGCRDEPTGVFETRSFLARTMSIFHIIQLAHKERIARIEMQYTKAARKLGLTFSPSPTDCKPRSKYSLHTSLGMKHIGHPYDRFRWSADSKRRLKDAGTI
jgi:hypothetical protein